MKWHNVFYVAVNLVLTGSETSTSYSSEWNGRDSNEKYDQTVEKTSSTVFNYDLEIVEASKAPLDAKIEEYIKTVKEFEKTLPSEIKISVNTDNVKAELEMGKVLATYECPEWFSIDRSKNYICDSSGRKLVAIVAVYSGIRGEYVVGARHWNVIYGDPSEDFWFVEPEWDIEDPKMASNADEKVKDAMLLVEQWLEDEGKLDDRYKLEGKL